MNKYRNWYSKRKKTLPEKIDNSDEHKAALSDYYKLLKREKKEDK